MFLRFAENRSMNAEPAFPDDPKVPYLSRLGGDRPRQLGIIAERLQECCSGNFRKGQHVMVPGIPGFYVTLACGLLTGPVTPSRRRSASRPRCGSRTMAIADVWVEYVAGKVR
jgi:hypothetical protein